MKKILSSLVLSLCFLRATAEVFVAPSNEVVFLTIPTNQTMLISSVKTGDYPNGSISYLAGWIVQDGVTNSISFPSPNGSSSTPLSCGPFALNGPSQIAFVGGTIGDTRQPAPVVVSYNLLQNSLLRSLIALPGSTNVISVPAGKSIRFLSPTSTGMYGPPKFTIQSGANSVYNVQINNGDEFTGPLTITIINGNSYNYPVLISYYFTDDFFGVPDTGYISGPTGSFEIAVEKSADMTAWCPVVVYNTGSDQKAFYRLRINK